MITGRVRAGCLAVFALAGFAASSLGAAADVSAALGAAQSAYLREDAAALGKLAGSAAAYAKGSAAERYAFAFVQFRLQQLAYGAKRKDDAAAAGEKCLAALEPALASGKDPESLALASACHGYLANLGGLKAISNGPKSRKRIDAALALAPSNARVVFVDGLNYFYAPSAFGGDKAKALERFKSAARLFEASAAPGSPAWGAAECWLFVGRASAEAGDEAAAQAAYQKALKLAPDFAAARRRAGTKGS